MLNVARRPQVPDEGDPGAPGESGGRVAARRGAVEQSTQRFDDRREGLILRELPNTLAHLVGRHDRAAHEGQQDQRHDGEACGFRSFRSHSQRDREPGGRESCRRDDADRAEPIEEGRRRPEPQRERHPDDGRNGYRAAQHGGHDVTGQDGTAGDVHDLEPVDDALRHVGAHGYRSGRQPVADGQQDQTWCCVVDVVPADIECVAEHVHEDQHDHDRHQNPVEYRDRIPKDVLEVATQHDPRIGQRC